jgi:hypothetical protein
MTSAPRSGRRGMPLALFALLIAGWISARAVLWENPLLILALESAPETMSKARQAARSRLAPSAQTTRSEPALEDWEVLAGRSPSEPSWDPEAAPLQWLPDNASPALVAQPLPSERPPVPPKATVFHRTSPPKPLPQAAARRPDRWSLDAWGVWRQGSSAAPISQGRVPIYGASQIGAVVNYRLAPSSAQDPRLYARAYRAIVPRGESEAALGASARPLAALPLRIFGEMRFTDNQVRREWRPAAFVVSEVPALNLPLDTTLEAYGQLGYVGGTFDTPFVDAQAVITRQIAEFPSPTGGALRLSVGSGVWGGAQEDASRLDIGPTLRLDLSIGSVPARVSIDWRERIGGDAAPESGLAATLSTRF